MIFFEHVIEGPPDAVFGLMGTFRADQRPEKINLMVGIYKDEHLKSEVMPVVKKAKEKVLASDQMADYLPFDGAPQFFESLGKLVFREWGNVEDRVYATQAIGGTGALRLGADFLAQEVGKRVWIPQPTWANHRGIFERAGFTVETLPYYSSAQHGIDKSAYFKHLRSLPPKSVVLFHGTCHNPTGCDPTLEEWKEISHICKERSLLPFFDFAYQGFGDGVEEDAGPVRLFLDEGHEFLVAYSCSKNFSLYCQRVGALFVVCKEAAVKPRVGSQIKRIIRTTYSNPPAHGAKIVAEVLNDRALKVEWLKELDQMRHRISQARALLVKKLVAKAKKIDFRFVQQHKGMFSYLDLSPKQVKELMEKHGIYMLDSGRINVAGLTSQNIDRVVDQVIAVSEA
ncbi:MAG: aspartate/tyrosine/aromatic aminotransferase [Verrucomicrobiota bacterium]|nr:aspartate/tyrosine/aromatic aminotransferase [Verrucomicrobiota bacterium]